MAVSKFYGTKAKADWHFDAREYNSKMLVLVVGRLFGKLKVAKGDKHCDVPKSPDKRKKRVFYNALFSKIGSAR